jgi:nucleoside-diphosphate-sugar epimerase
MILLAGGSGTLGTRIVRLLKARGLEVRLLVRDSARDLEGDLVEVVPGDVLDPRRSNGRRTEPGSSFRRSRGSVAAVITAPARWIIRATAT